MNDTTSICVRENCGVVATVDLPAWGWHCEHHAQFWFDVIKDWGQRVERVMADDW